MQAVLARFRMVWGILFLALIWGVSADILRFHLDPDRSRVEVGGVVRVAGTSVLLREQGPGSLIARYAGHLDVDVTEDAIRFVEGGALRPLETASWEPEVGGDEGAAPASYGVRATVNLFIFSATAVAAVRELAFDAVSDVLPLVDGRFPSDQVRIRFLEGAASAVDFRVSGALEQAGRRLNAGMLTNRVGVMARLELVDGVETLRVPVDANYGFTVESDLGPADFDLDFIGEWVAVRGGEGEVAPAVRFELPTDANGVLRLLFDDALFRLQRAARLAEEAWLDYSETSPIEVMLDGPGWFYRVVPR